MKFTKYEELKHNKHNNLILVSCKKCGCAFDSTLSPNGCYDCKLKIQCQICVLPVNGLFTWCSTCLHGGHPEHINSWFSGEGGQSKALCAGGCGHRC